METKSVDPSDYEMFYKSEKHLKILIEDKKTLEYFQKKLEAIPSQADESTNSLGVCNEQTSPPEGKVCSELHGDMKR